MKNFLKNLKKMKFQEISGRQNKTKKNKQAKKKTKQKTGSSDGWESSKNT